MEAIAWEWSVYPVLDVIYSAYPMSYGRSVLYQQGNLPPCFRGTWNQKFGEKRHSRSRCSFAAHTLLPIILMSSRASLTTIKLSASAVTMVNLLVSRHLSHPYRSNPQAQKIRTYGGPCHPIASPRTWFRAWLLWHVVIVFQDILSYVHSSSRHFRRLYGAILPHRRRYHQLWKHSTPPFIMSRVEFGSVFFVIG